MLKQQSAVTTQSVRHNFVDSLSQYSKTSDDLAGNSEIIHEKQSETKPKIVPINGKKTSTNFGVDKGMGKTISKKLPDLNLSTNSVSGEQAMGKQNKNMGQTSDSDQEILAYQSSNHIKMPLIKAGSQLSDIYQTSGKPPKNLGNDIGLKK